MCIRDRHDVGLEEEQRRPLPLGERDPGRLLAHLVAAHGWPRSSAIVRTIQNASASPRHPQKKHRSASEATCVRRWTKRRTEFIGHLILSGHIRYGGGADVRRRLKRFFHRSKKPARRVVGGTKSRCAK